MCRMIASTTAPTGIAAIPQQTTSLPVAPVPRGVTGAGCLCLYGCARTAAGDNEIEQTDETHSSRVASAGIAETEDRVRPRGAARR
jgi:hypothetical protein